MSIDRKMPLQGHGSQHKPGQPQNRLQPHKPVVVQTKTVAAQQFKPPTAAPPVYRPQPVPGVLQAKLNAPVQSINQSKREPVAPPVYRPQSPPKVLQRQTAPVPPQPVNATNRLPAAPPVYHPQPPPRVLQAKAVKAQGFPATPNTLQRSATQAQSKMGVAPGSKTGLAAHSLQGKNAQQASPAYPLRPVPNAMANNKAAPAPGVLQRKVVANLQQPDKPNAMATPTGQHVPVPAVAQRMVSPHHSHGEHPGSPPAAHHLAVNLKVRLDTRHTRQVMNPQNSTGTTHPGHFPAGHGHHNYPGLGAVQCKMSVELRLEDLEDADWKIEKVKIYRGSSSGKASEGSDYGHVQGIHSITAPWARKLEDKRIREAVRLIKADADAKRAKVNTVKETTNSVREALEQLINYKVDRLPGTDEDPSENRSKGQRTATAVGWYDKLNEERQTYGGLITPSKEIRLNASINFIGANFNIENTPDRKKAISVFNTSWKGYPLLDSPTHKKELTASVVKEYPIESNKSLIRERNKRLDSVPKLNLDSDDEG